MSDLEWVFDGFLCIIVLFSALLSWRSRARSRAFAEREGYHFTAGATSREGYPITQGSVLACGGSQRWGNYGELISGMRQGYAFSAIYYVYEINDSYIDQTIFCLALRQPQPTAYSLVTDRLRWQCAKAKKVVVEAPPGLADYLLALDDPIRPVIPPALVQALASFEGASFECLHDKLLLYRLGRVFRGDEQLLWLDRAVSLAMILDGH